ncbi:hypothetical protein DBR13_07620 [Aeromonas sp. HMWF015]|nr:hypothetical protein DBR13_07620 [Aeromonas sp. HMWF015]
MVLDIVSPVQKSCYGLDKVIHINACTICIIVWLLIPVLFNAHLNSQKWGMHHNSTDYLMKFKQQLLSLRFTEDKMAIVKKIIYG